jgi:hypothetical protein
MFGLDILNSTIGFNNSFPMWISMELFEHKGMFPKLKVLNNKSSKDTIKGDPTLKDFQSLHLHKSNEKKFNVLNSI